MDKKYELMCFQLITAAGTAKTKYMEAVEKAKKGFYDEARTCIKEGDRLMAESHAPHMEMIQQEAAGDPINVGLILVHAETQLMNSEVFKILAEELIEVYEKLDKK